MKNVNCVRCGKLFTWMETGSQVCPNCKAAEEELFQKVKQYIYYDGTYTTITDVAKHFEIKPAIIQRWLREERLVLSDKVPLKLHCEKCGEQIMTGRFCNKCKAEEATALLGLQPKGQFVQMQKPTHGNSAMRFLKGDRV